MFLGLGFRHNDEKQSHVPAFLLQYATQTENNKFERTTTKKICEKMKCKCECVVCCILYHQGKCGHVCVGASLICD